MNSMCVFFFAEVEITESMVHNSTRQYLLKLIIFALDQPAPNLAHFLLGFEVRKPVNKTNLQDPGKSLGEIYIYIYIFFFFFPIISYNKVVFCELFMSTHSHPRQK